MNRDDVTRWAREADFGDGIVEFIGVQKFERFAALVAAAEREACAKVCETNHGTIKRSLDSFECAAAIRARSTA